MRAWAQAALQHKGFWTFPGLVDKFWRSNRHRRKSMSTKRYTPEFKDEAVRQVVDRGYSVAEVADRLGVSAHKPA